MPPEMTREIRPRTAARNSSAIAGRRVSTSTRRSTLNGRSANFRIDTIGPSTAMGRMATLTREPSGNRASTIGEDSSTRRPIPETILLMIRKQMRFVLEADVGALQFAKPLNKAKGVRVDQDIADRRILEQGLDRAKTGHFSDHLVGEDVEFLLVERDAFGANIIVDIGLYLPMQFLWRKFFQQRKVEFVDDKAMQLELLVEQSWPARDQVAIESFNIGLRYNGIEWLCRCSGSRPLIGLHGVTKQKTHGHNIFFIRQDRQRLRNYPDLLNLDEG